MRILLISSLYAPEARGGAESVARMIAGGLSNGGHEVVVLSTTARTIDGVEETTDDGVRVLRYRPRLPYHILEDAAQPLWRRFLWHGTDLLPWCSQRVTQRIIHEVKPEVIMTHNLRGMGMGVARAIRQSTVRWIHTLHDIQLLVPSAQYWFDRVHMWQWPIVAKPYQWWVRRLMGSPHVVVGPTRFVVDAHVRAGFFRRSALHVLRNPVTDVLPSTERPPVHDPVSLAFLGQLVPHKGLHVLMEALKRLGEVGAHLDVFGDGPERGALEASASRLPIGVTVKFWGRVPHDELMRRLSEHDALVLPSVLIENCPGTVLEANALGLPVIASAVGGVPELIDPFGLVPPADPAALAEKIHSLREGRVHAVTPGTSIKINDYISQLEKLSQ